MTYDPLKDGERRTDGHSVRLALVERSFFEIKESQAAVHKRLSEQDVKFDNGISAILERMEAQEAERRKACKECQDDVNALKTSSLFIDRWLLAISGALVTMSGWIFHHGSRMK